MSVDLGAARTDPGSSWSQKVAVQGRPVENSTVAAVVIASAVVAWMHIRSESIWYDETITLLTTSGHATLDWSFGVLQFAHGKFDQDPFATLQV